MEDYKIKITADSSGVDQTLAKTNKEVEKINKGVETFGKGVGKASKSVEGLGQGVEKVGKEVNGLGGSFTGILSKIAPVAAAIGVVTAATMKFFSAYREQEQAEIRTAQTLKATGYAAGITKEELYKLSAALQSVTTFGDDTILAGENMLLTFRNIGASTFPRATEAMLDMATAMGTDLSSSAIQLGKALNSPTEGLSSLSRVGVQFTKEQKEQIKTLEKSGKVTEAQGIILSELEKQFGGVARAAAAGSGITKQAANEWGEFAEMVGKILLPTITSAGKGFLWLAKVAQKAVAPFMTGKDQFDILPQEDKIKRTEQSLLALEASLVKVNLQAKHAGSSFVSNEYIDKNIQRITQQIEKEKEHLDQLKNNYSEETALAAEGKAKQDAIQKKANDLRLANRAELNTAIKSLDDEFNAADSMKQLENLKIQQEAMAQARIEAQALELEEKGAHNEALALLNQYALEQKIKKIDEADKKEKERLKASVAFNKTVSDTILANKFKAADMAIAILGQESKAAFLIGKAVAVAQVMVADGMARASATASAMQAGMGAGPAAAAVITATLAKLHAQITLGTSLSIGTIAATAIKGMAKGGLVEGGTRGKDSVPALLMPNEVVIPAKTSFSDIVSAGRSLTGEASSGGGQTEVIISLKDDLINFVETEIVKRRSLGVSIV